jgi:hypothetical protein
MTDQPLSRCSRRQHILEGFPVEGQIERNPVDGAAGQPRDFPAARRPQPETDPAARAAAPSRKKRAAVAGRPGLPCSRSDQSKLDQIRATFREQIVNYEHRRRRRSITWSPVAAVLGLVAVELQTACRCTRQTNRRCTSRGRVLEYDVGIAHGSEAILQPLAVTMPGLNGFQRKAAGNRAVVRGRECPRGEYGRRGCAVRRALRLIAAFGEALPSEARCRTKVVGHRRIPQTRFHVAV